MTIWSSIKLGSTITKCLSSKKTDALKTTGMDYNQIQVIL